MRRLLQYGIGDMRFLNQLTLRQGLSPVLDLSSPGAEFFRPNFSFSSGTFFHNNPSRIAVSPNGLHAVAIRGGSAGTISGKGFWCWDDYEALYPESSPLAEFFGSVYAVAASNEYFAVGGNSPYLYVYDWENKALQPQFATTGLNTVRGLAFSPDGTKLVVTHDSSPYLRVYDVATGAYTNAASSAGSSRYAAAFLPDGTICVSGTGSPYFTHWSDDLSTLLFSSSTYAYRAGSSWSSTLVHPLKTNTVIFTTGSHGEATNGASWFEYDGDTHTITEIPKPDALEGNVCPVFSLAYDGVNNEFLITHGRYQNRYFSRVKADTYELLPPEEQKDFELLCRAPEVELAIFEKDVHRISGTVRDIDNNPAAREIYAYRRSDGLLMAKTLSDAGTGNYELILPDAGPYDVQFRAADGELLNDLFYARAVPEPVT